LFSAAVAALAAVSIQDLRPNSQDTVAFYLANIYQLLADPNVSRASILAAPAKPPSFSPPKYAIWVNSLWFLSLVSSLTCALLATLLQQWARRYITATQPPRYSPHKRARIRAFFADGVEKFHLPWAVETLPTLLHVSLFLFFSGLLIFLFNINHTTFSVVVWWIGLLAGIYGCITLMPIFRHDSPYYAPLSLTAWFLYNGVTYAVLRILMFITYVGACSVSVWYSSDLRRDITRRHFGHLIDTFHGRLLGGVVKTAQETASKLAAEIDGRVLSWTFDALDEDHELEQFFEGIPGFCSSNVVHNPQNILNSLGDSGLGDALSVFRSRTLSSSFLSETLRERRLMVYMKAADALRHPFLEFDNLTKVFRSDKDGVLRSVQMGHVLRNWCHSSDSTTALYAQGIIAGIIARVPERDCRWKAIVMNQLGVSEDVLQDYLAHGASVLLANLIHITRQFFRFYHLDGWVPFHLLLIQRTISRFDIQNTSPGLQHDFCALWNEMTREAHNDESYAIPFNILRPIRHIYIALHQGTNAAPTAFSTSTADDDSILHESSSYPLCNIPGHHSHILEEVLDATGETTYPPTITSHSLASRHRFEHHHSFHRTWRVIPPRIDPDHDHIHLPEESSLRDDVPDTTLNSTQGRIDTPTISPTANSESDQCPASVVSTRTTHAPFAPPSSNTVDAQYNAVLDVVPGIPFSSSPAPVLSDTHPANRQSSLASPASRIGQVTVTASPGLLPSASAMTIALTSPQETSVSHPNMASNVGTFDTHHNSPAPDLSNNVGAPQRPHQLAMSVPDIATDLVCHSPDTVPSSRDADRPE
jgi:Family of unknown function (DUF6535)